MARPSKLNDAVHDAICADVRAGLTFAEACRRAGISAATGREWRARGRGRDAQRPWKRAYVRFALAVDEAERARDTPKTEFAAFAAPAYSDTPQKRARAREQETPKTVSGNDEAHLSSRAWVSQTSRRQGGLTSGLLDKVF